MKNSFGDNTELWGTGPGQNLEDELEASEYRIEELEMLLADVRNLFQSMEKAEDMPSDPHRLEVESLHDQIKETL